MWRRPPSLGRTSSGVGGGACLPARRVGGGEAPGRPLRCNPRHYPCHPWRPLLCGACVSLVCAAANGDHQTPFVPPACARFCLFLHLSPTLSLLCTAPLLCSPYSSRNFARQVATRRTTLAVQAVSRHAVQQPQREWRPSRVRCCERWRPGELLWQLLQVCVGECTAPGITYTRTRNKKAYAHHTRTPCSPVRVIFL